MRKIQFFCVLLLLLASSRAAFGQQLSPTTEEEYNYLTRGYKIQVSSGLDMKKGYQFRELQSMNEGNYHFDYKFLVRERDNSVAGILVVIDARYLLTGPVTYYLCLPVGGALMGRFDADLNTIKDNNLIRAYTKTVSMLASNSFAYVVREKQQH